MIRPVLFLFLLAPCGLTSAQVKIGETLSFSHLQLRTDVDEEEFRDFVTEDLIPQLKDTNLFSYHLLKADRGDQKGKYLFVQTTNKSTNLKRSDYLAAAKRITGNESLKKHLANAATFSQYHLIGADKIGNLPTSGVLGLHFIKVKKERAEDFENLVERKLHPAVSQLFPDMQLFYYKCVDGENKGSYLTLFTIDSPGARDRYWPEGKPETEILKKTFKPLEALAKELGTYLEPGTFLEPESGGAAAYWESKEWTDYVHNSHLD